MAKKKRNRDPLNLDNTEFRTTLTPHKTKEVIGVMEYIGCTDRGAWTKMCFELGIKTYGEPKS